MALVICNLGGISKISNGMINPYLLFDHQTIESSDDDPNQPVINDFQNNNHINAKKSLGIDGIVPIAEGMNLIKDTEKGEIDFYYNTICTQDLPLCVKNSTIASWVLWAKSTGGYEPRNSSTAFALEQKNEFVGYIGIEWTYQGKGQCCSIDFWKAKFYVTENICLDSNQYPTLVGPWSPTLIKPEGKENWEWGTIDDKEVIMTYENTWAGCHLTSQEFTILSVREIHQFP